MTTYETYLDFVFDVTDGERVRLTYDSSHSDTPQVIEGIVEDAHMSEYTTVRHGNYRYQVWNGSGVKGREDGDVKRFSDDSRSRKVGTFISAETVDEEVRA